MTSLPFREQVRERGARIRTPLDPPPARGGTLDTPRSDPEGPRQT